MKIEIEFEEVVRMESEIAELKADNLELYSQLSELDEDKINEDIITLSSAMFGSVMDRVFKELGFNDKTFISGITFAKLTRELGREWWLHPRLELTIGTTISNKFREAFIELGYKS